MCICIAYRLLVSLNATIAIVNTGEEHVISLRYTCTGHDMHLLHRVKYV